MVQPARQSTVAAEEAAIKLQQASFAWERNQPAVLSNFSLEVGRGQLVMVVGRVGAGKSSLLAALLGELHPRGGSLQVIVVPIRLCQSKQICFAALPKWLQLAITANKHYQASMHVTCYSHLSYGIGTLCQNII